MAAGFSVPTPNPPAVPSEGGGDNGTAHVATVYVHDGSAYQPTGGRIFIGPEDPAVDGFTLTDGDQWEETP